MPFNIGGNIYNGGQADTQDYYNIVTRGLVLNLDTSAPSSYPGSGTSWSNINGNSNNGTLTNGPTFNSANGGSIVFDGTNDYVECGSAIITGNNSWSWSSWIYPTSTGTPFFLGVNSNSQAMVSFWDSSNSAVRVGIWADDKLTSTQTILVNTWGLTAWTWDGTTLKSYTNGVASGTATGFSFNINASVTQIGTAFNSQYFGGRIASTLVYNRALASAEISQNFNIQRSRFGI